MDGWLQMSASEARVNVLDQASGEGWALYNGDSVEVLPGIPDNSVGLSIHSPPYLNLYVYQASPRDIGNSRSDDDFWSHYGLVVDHLLRVMKPGRVAVVDVMNVPAMKSKDGFIGLKDFRGAVISRYTAAGFIFHSEHCCFKDPLLEATRTKAIGLAHKQLVKDSALCRAGIPQYLLAFRKPGTNPEPIAHPNGVDYFVGENPPEHGNLSHERWRRYAAPVWMDIDFTRTLNARASREDEDERHIAPMSLDLIERALWLWSNEGDVVLDPCNGIGSTGYCALRNKRRYVGIELKTAWYQASIANLAAAADDRQQLLF